jgi:hypothetical protein
MHPLPFRRLLFARISWLQTAWDGRRNDRAEMIKIHRKTTSQVTKTGTPPGIGTARCMVALQRTILRNRLGRDVVA